MKKFALALSFLVLPLATVPALTSCNTEPDYIKRTRQLEEEQKKNDDVLIQDYLTRNSITNYTRLTSGIYLIPVTEGPTSNPLIKAGNKVTTKYIGSFIGKDNEGLVFEASSDNRTTCGCFGFVNGQTGTISGWNTATLEMRKGDRKKVIIPSYLAYGAAGSAVIPPNTPLLFDMEILDVQ
ncbi:FKBP-type peptidyl-prolyl cis-trans isomerase [Hymenobacter luteus]|uniref:Peptidyl-prolyl cis-trans isomerase n=2 Tax=Hymenobacter TaxID=89966 RepID=A0A7W9T317_9BACT|nr:MULTISPECIES: FKBP-type peptidyl-prolyl cis-trans isomerase [Hymenobacter]MBB4602770.1 FKBP-type peptidyl-prolyl cis-trans isomerase [Hymenobacter latericoloratus]MBB6060661.1 FKBP-type peptidyl-prolyl cis-trans isomerase [Hymenobacter luteus]